MPNKVPRNNLQLLPAKDLWLLELSEGLRYTDVIILCLL